MKKEATGTLLAILAAAVSGIAIPANKIFVVDIDPTVYTAVRSLIIGIIFLFLSLWFTKKQKQKKFAVSWRYLAVIAVVGGALAFLLFFSGLQLTTSGRAAFLHKTLPLYVALIALVFLKETISKRFAIAMLMMIAGTVAIYSASISPAEFWSNPQLGDLMIIAATVLWAAENVVAKKAMTNGETNYVVSFARMFFGGLILFGAVLLTGKINMLFALTTGQVLNILISILLLFGYVLFYYWAIKLINVSKAPVLLLLAPIVSLFIGVTVLGEPAPALQLIGSAIILIGAFLIAGIKSMQREI